MRRIITVVNFKGGVGKTTTAMFLAEALRLRYQQSVALVDTDPQGSAYGWWENAKTHGGLPFSVFAPPAPHLRDLRRRLPDYDLPELVVIDTPPQHEQIVANAAAVADLVLIPVSPSGMDLDRLPATIDLLALLPGSARRPVAVLLTRTQPQTNSLKAARLALTELGMPLLRMTVPQREDIKNSFGTPPPNKISFYRTVLEELEQEGQKR